MEDGTLDSGYCKIRCEYGEDYVLNESGGISLRFYFFSLFDYEWWCDMELTFDEEGCHMELAEVSNRYRRYQEVIDTVTEYSMPEKNVNRIGCFYLHIRNAILSCMIGTTMVSRN